MNEFLLFFRRNFDDLFEFGFSRTGFTVFFIGLEEIAHSLEQNSIV